MNKQLDFRAWDKYNKKFIYSKKQGFGNNIANLTAFFATINTIPKTYIIQQTTEFKDKNKKTIYSGDIVKYWYDYGRNDFRIYEVYSGNKWGYVTIKRKYTYYNGKKETIFFNEIWDEKDIEIIGNIYQNPKLIKTTKQIKS